MRITSKKQTVAYSIELTREEAERLKRILGRFSPPNLADLMGVEFPSEEAEKNHHLTDELYLCISDHMREEEKEATK